MKNSKTRFKVLVLDHDDTTVNSTPEVNYPAFLETLSLMRPDVSYDFDTFQDICFNPGFSSLCQDILKFNEAEMKTELEIWLRYVKNTVPSACPGIERIIRRQKEAGGYVCVVSHSFAENILRDWKENFDLEPDAVYGWELGEDKRKPSPWPLEDICSRFGVGKDELIMIDDLKPGLDSAKSAGVTFGAALWGPHTEQIDKYMTENADICFRTTAELESFIFDEADEFPVADTKRLLSYARRGVDDYGMIEDGDKIAVGVSGGKDSLALLCALHGLQRFYPKKFELVAVTIGMNLPDMDFSAVKRYCEHLGVPFYYYPTEISTIIFDVRKEKNPCSLCAKMRRGALHNAAKELGCNKVALGHHFDDVIDTFMLNLFHEGRIGTFSPVTYLSRTEITVIRPLVYMPEKDIKYFAAKANLPVVKSTCPADKNTEREEVKQLLASLDREHKGLRYRIFGAIQRGEVDGFKEFSRMPGIKAYSDEKSDN